MTKSKPPFDEIGHWSEIKLEIIKEYARAYSRILSRQTATRFEHVYIDGFAGPGVHVSRATHAMVPGSPLVALEVQPPFKHYYFVDISEERTDHLENLVGERSDVTICRGDCNQILLHDIFPKARYEDFRRALCFLDPYALHLDWEVIRAAGQSKSIEIVLNFPIADINRNVLRRDPEKASPDQTERLTRYWGDDSWREAAYSKVPGLFCDIEEKTTNEALAQAFRDRLRKVAGFQCVPEPIPMRNNKRAIVYYLYFASQNRTGAKIARDIFRKYQDRGKT